MRVQGVYEFAMNIEVDGTCEICNTTEELSSSKACADNFRENTAL